MECCKTPHVSDCENCSYTGKRLEDGVYEGCVNCLVGDALALINSQEQRIGAQDITISELRKSLEKSAHDAERYERKVAELTEEVASWKGIAEGYQKQFEDCAEDRARLTEENESLKTQRRVLAVGLKDLRKEIKAIKADTVREMQERLIEELYKVAHCRHGDEYNMKSPEVFGIIDQIAKEMLEGENVAQEKATSDQYTQSCDYSDKTPEMLRQRVADIKRDILQKGLNAQNLHDYIIYRPLFALYGEEITGNLYVADELIKEINKGETKPNDENSIHNQKEEGR